MSQWIKDPQARRSFTFDWQTLGEPVTAATVTATPAGLTISAATIDATGRYVSVFVSGGTVGTRYDLLCHVESAGAAQVDEHTESLLILDL